MHCESEEVVNGGDTDKEVLQTDLPTGFAAVEPSKLLLTEPLPGEITLHQCIH